jgi:hypothetical protein
VKTPPDQSWLDTAKQALEQLAALYHFEELDIHSGPIGAIHYVNVSWQGPNGMSYVSLALPKDECPPYVYAAALEKLMYGETNG